MTTTTTTSARPLARRSSGCSGTARGLLGGRRGCKGAYTNITTTTTRKARQVVGLGRGVSGPRRSATVRAFFESEEGEAQIPDAQGYIDGSAGDGVFDLSKISFGDIALYTGTLLLAYGFGAYFDFLPGTSASAVMLIYGFPASLIGFALKYAQLLPVGCRSKPEAIPLRKTKATDIQNQIREDVTRFRYGDEQHLDLALERIFTFGRFGGIPRRASPLLTGVREEVRDGEFVLVLEFENKPKFEHSEFESRIDKIQTFFGPGIIAECEPTAQGSNVFLISDGSGEGRGGGEGDREILPPLMPGLPARKSNL